LVKIFQLLYVAIDYIIIDCTKKTTCSWTEICEYPKLLYKPSAWLFTCFNYYAEYTKTIWCAFVAYI